MVKDFYIEFGLDIYNPLRSPVDVSVLITAGDDLGLQASVGSPLRLATLNYSTCVAFCVRVALYAVYLLGRPLKELGNDLVL